MVTLREARARLAAAGVPSPDHDARALLRHAECAGVDAEPLVAAREDRVPLQHLIGSIGFRHLDLLVGPGVFVPRPETEVVVEAVLAAVAGIARPRVVDLCAGSGALGLSVAYEHPGSFVDLVEMSESAVLWLRRNVAGARWAQPDGRPPSEVRVHHADLADAPTGADGAVDVVASNPPYVALHERDLVDPEVRDHDPAEALWAGADGLDVIRRVVDRATVLLRPGGTLVVEHSDRQGESCPALLQAAGFIDVRDHLDLTGRPRFTTATWPA
ncbi:MAG TPA: peptide chain release factor N(5)-glutamine methyltransferase [Mycobacteriales bacterium]|nr:peptide chain release factor N(5)-glutamine methyltransferase [Mycobacteriales bacterium]HVU60520.1 peptide chain release factor N(5)-glutamine methyltransferase [Mycobacteriales bacterium]